MTKIYKLQALGNSYLVLDSHDFPEAELDPEFIKKISSPHWGLGSDGVLWGPGDDLARPRLRIFNTDGGEAEKSGNGIRIFSRYLVERRNFPRRFDLATLGGLVSVDATELPLIEVDMGPCQILSEGGVLEHKIFGDKNLGFLRVDIGNPHCVVFEGFHSLDEVKSLGPLIEKDALFPNRSNVQFVKVLNKNEIEIQIWERGSGFTLASGSSSCAAAFAAYSQGLLAAELRVNMLGGSISIRISPENRVFMKGPVEWIAEGHLL
jgi:diaminopimelate epimerase